MKVLIVEDEKPIARYIERCCRQVLGNRLRAISLAHSLNEAKALLQKKEFDICLLDLNLNGKNGYDLLKLAISGSFHTIIISAHTEQAVEAFQYGVLDFIPKPFDEERLKSAFARFFEVSSRAEPGTRYLTVRKKDGFEVLKVASVLYFKAAGNYVEAHMRDGSSELLEKSMDRLEQILPQKFNRIHRSYIVDFDEIKSYAHVGGGTYSLSLKSGISLPLSRQKYKELRKRMSDG